MKLCLINHDFRYEIEKTVRLFLPFYKLEYFNTKEDYGDCIITEIKGNLAYSYISINGKTAKKSEIINNVHDEKESELRLASTLFDCFFKITGYAPEWGMQTGVRPSKLFSRLVREMGFDDACEYLKHSLKVSDKKIALCNETHESEESIISLSKPNSFSLYVSIPFCPTRCSYCSFVSHSVASAKKLIPEYLEKLCAELEYTARIVKEENLRLETVYIGGGTPTTLEASQLEMLMKAIERFFDLSCLREYTVEAGRPDTITKDKLLVIKKHKATRISINPQTMNDSVLKEIGRQHTAKQTKEAFLLARECGHENINMDLIAGLPTDTFESFKKTLDDVFELNPESVTVHSLSMKRSSKLNLDGDFPEIEMGKTAEQMVDYAHQALTEKLWLPYYMYRQSKTVGNLENVGYAKAGFECLYNVYIMDETHTILACGASAVTKLREPFNNHIERIFNYKYPYEYIGNFEEIISRKAGIKEFYVKYGNRD